MAVRILNDNLINKIAAGEVVERPASVLKELVENALDAGAKDLRVHLRAGGKTLIRVSDDGSGMDRTDAVMCLERHATSKIQTDGDLFRIHTLGFRGEAIPSIASVSRFEIQTRTAASDTGTRVVVEGGTIVKVEECGCPPGTDIRVGSLFFNIPARKKFLRAAETELSHCLEAVTREALIRPQLDLEVMHDDREVIRCLRTTSRHQRAAELLGAHGEALVPASFRRGNLEVEALISPVGVHRSSAQGSSYLYVNGRFVRDQVLRKAVTQAYQSIVPKDRYPVVILELRLPPGEVDVNVHPAKVEVRFLHGNAVTEAVAAGLREALAQHGIHRPVEIEARYRPAALPDAQLSLQRAPEVWAEAPEPPPERRAEEPPLDAPEVWVEPGSGAGEEPQAATPACKTDTGELQAATPDCKTDTGELQAATPACKADTGELQAATPARAAEPADLQAATPARAAEPADLQPATPAQQAAQGRVQAAPVLTAARPAPVSARDVAVARLRGEPVAGGLSALPPAGAGRPLLNVRRYQDLRIIGQLARTYILCEGQGELLIVDQHAAHERVHLERLQKLGEAAFGPPQRLLTPILIDLAPGKAAALAPALEVLGGYGLDVRFMGKGTFAVQAIPPSLKAKELPELLADAADDLSGGGSGRSPEERVQRVLATMACHASVRAGQELSQQEMMDILRALDIVDFGVCAHGRPVIVRLDVSELERRFHRS